MNRALKGAMTMMVAATSAAAVVACSGDDASPSAPMADASVFDGAYVPIDAAIVDASADHADDARDAALTDASEASTADAEAGIRDAAPDVEVPPPDAGVCGSGWRTLDKECDDGLGVDASVRRSCTAQCQVLDLLAHAPAIVDGGPPPAGRTLGAGRHPIAVTDDDVFAVAYVETQPTVSLSLTHFGRKGIASDVVTTFSAGTTPLADSNPVLAGFPGGRFVAAYTELGGDGDGQGIAMRVVMPGGAVSAPMFANQGNALNQHDPDAVWTGSQLVVAWVDDSNEATAPDLRFRVFDANLVPTSGDQTLAGGAAAETDVALAAFGAGWAAAWREVGAQSETVHAVAGNAAWSVGPFAAAPADNKPAIAALDATHLLVVFAVGGSVAKIQGAVLDVNAPGNVAPFDIPGAAMLAQSEPNVVRVGTRTFIAWKTDRAIPDPNGYAEELWIREIAWNGVTIDLGAAEIPLPRWTAHRAGDQRRAALAASGLPAEGAVVAAWDDLGGDFGAGEAAGDVAAELMPAPALRGDGGGGV